MVYQYPKNTTTSLTVLTCIVLTCGFPTVFFWKASQCRKRLGLAKEARKTVCSRVPTVGSNLAPFDNTH